MGNMKRRKKKKNSDILGYHQAGNWSLVSSLSKEPEKSIQIGRRGSFTKSMKPSFFTPLKAEWDKKKNKNTKAMTTAATTKPRKRNKLCSEYYRNIGGKVFLETCRFCLEWDQVNHDSVLAEPWKPPRMEIAIAPRWPVPVLHRFPVKAFLLMLNLNPSSLLS